MSARARVLVVVLAVAVVGCADTQALPGDACGPTTDCGPGRACLEGACRAADDADVEPLDAGLVDAGEVVDAAPDAALGGVGAPCDDAADCLDGPCIEAAGDGRRVCTGPCSPADPAGCPDGFVCAAVGNAGPDRTFLCFPAADILCRPCEDDSDCGGLSDRCVEQLDGRFCARACDLRACPDGFDCAPQMDGQAQCVPIAGVCSGCLDADADGHGIGLECQGPDCDDDDGDVYPGADETCDGGDDDCDGVVDEGFDLMSDPRRCGACDRVCRFEGADALCAEGECILGPCLADRYDLDRRVDNGCEYFCEGDPSAPEACDGADDDCDGAIDEGRPGADADCPTGEPGRCAAGVTACEAGELVCRRRFDPLPETCDGTDEDCDGQVDEGLAELGGACETGRPGRCAAGVRVCVDGGPACDARPGPRGEVCDDVDDDCDGVVDDGCPDGIATGPDRALAAFGGGGGGAFELRCGAGQAAVGVDVRAGSEIDQVTVICQRVGLAVDRAGSPHGFATTGEGGQARTGAAGGGGGGLETFVCPGGSFLHALQVRSGARVDQASFTCARLDFVGYPDGPRTTRADTGSRTFGGNGGGLQALQRCRDDELVTGLFGRAGGRIDQLGPLCRAIGVQVR